MEFRPLWGSTLGLIPVLTRKKQEESGQCLAQGQNPGKSRQEEVKPRSPLRVCAE